MKIRVAILDQDQNYQNRILVALRERFSRKLQVFPCNNKEDILGVIEEHEIKVFAINKTIDFDITQVPEECAVIYLSEVKVSGDINGTSAVCKYQKVANIANALYEIGNNHDKVIEARKAEEKKAEEERLEAERKAEEERLKEEKKAEEERVRLEEEKLKAEKKAEEERLEAERKEAEEEKLRQEEEKKAEEERLAQRRKNPEIYAFVSAGSRDGSTTASIACAMNNSDSNLNILYLDLKQFSSMRRFFCAADTEDTEVKFSDVLNKASNDELEVEELEKCIVTDVNLGMDFINNTDCAFEIVMLGDKGFEKLFKTIGEMVRYDIVIINLESAISQMNFAVLNAAKKVIFVGNGVADSNNNIERNVNVIRKYDSVNETDNISKVNILYNKFANRNCTTLSLNGINVVGTINIIKEKTEMKVIETMSKMVIFRQIIE